LQKENDRLLHKHRAIREATAGMVSAAFSKYGADPESKWLQAHAAELAALRADEKENLREIDA
jgi:DNA-binding FadR family transcriptional regulator